ncbi:phosphatase PAP2 family protein [Novosphingobium sp. 9]|uniref:phosphatase PAP2 family protein n=1 Tax=Novosphingobium sp. 9 TaxID=2025349 RepID=UPI0021B5BDEE|nr:phosphatase PAP2 family protein [Novosphingobium sp. 9]
MISSRMVLSLLAGGCVLLALLLHAADVEIAARAPGTLLYTAIFAVLGLFRWRTRGTTHRILRPLGDMVEYAALFMVVTLTCAIASYPVAALSRGFADAALQRADMALHFDWLAWYRMVAAHPLLQDVSRSAYAMIYVSPAILLGWLAWTGQRRVAHDFIVAVCLAAWITLFAFWFMPAVGPFAYLWHGAIPYLPVSDLWQPQVIPQLRAHVFTEVDPGHLVGLVSAPSFHAAAATLLITFAARQKVIRWPLIAINVAMLLSTPVEGTHYLTDMILGAIVAGIALQLTVLLREWVGVRVRIGTQARKSGALA